MKGKPVAKELIEAERKAEESKWSDVVDDPSEIQKSSREEEKAGKECPFKVGDVVQHKASKEKAVVEAINYRCPEHSKYPGISLACNDDCVKVPTGWIIVNTGFGKEVKSVNVLVLERKAE